MTSALVLRWTLFASSAHPTGLDGYFYYGQVTHYLATGSFKVADRSPVLLLITAICAVAPDVVTGLKLFSVTAGALLTLAAYLIGTALSGRRLVGLVAAALSAGSPAVTHMGIEFLRNLGALVALLFGGYLLWKATAAAVESKGRRLRLVAYGFSGVFLLVVSALGHRLCAGLLIIFCCGLAFRQLLLGGGQRIVWVLLAGVLLVGPTLLLLGQMAPGLLRVVDLSRFATAFDPVPGLPPLSVAYRRALDPTLLCEISGYWLTFLALLVWDWAYRGNRLARLREISTVFTGVLFFLFQPFWSLDSLDMGFRMHLTGAVLFPFWAAYRWRNVRLGRWAPLVCLVAVLPVFHTRPVVPLPYAKYDQVIAQLRLPARSLLICEQGFSIYYFVRTGRDALHYLPEQAPPVHRLWRLTQFVPAAVIERAVPGARARGHVRDLPFPYLAVREDVFQGMLGRIDPELRRAFMNTAHPMRRRPRFLIH